MIAHAKHDPIPSPDGWTEIPESEATEESVLKLDNDPCPCDPFVVPDKLTVTIDDCPDDCPCSIVTVVPASLTVTVGNFSETVPPEEVQAAVARLLARYFGNQD